MDDLLPREFSTRLQNKHAPMSALKHSSSSGSGSTSARSANQNILNGFGGPHSTASSSNLSSMPVYDDDMFGNAFGSLNGRHVVDGNLSGRSMDGFDDLLSGFGRQPETTRQTPSSLEDPFAIFETASASTTPSVINDPFENLGKTSIQSLNTNNSSYGKNTTSSDQFPRIYVHLETTDEAFLTVDEIPLFTKPLTYPAPSRIPPPPVAKSVPYGKTDHRRKGKEPYPQASSSSSYIDELEEFAMSKPQSNGDDLETKKARERKEKLDREREEREKEKKRLEKEREIESKRNIQFVEKANREAHERSAAEYHLHVNRERGAAAAAREKQHKSENDLESFFDLGTRATTSDNIFDTQAQSSGSANGTRRASSTTNFMDDLTFIFGGPASSGEFQEVEGESDERRRARLERHQRTHERTIKVLAEKQERDMQTQREQDERHRISDTLDIEIKRWTAGKEGNLRALLSTLQYVLWPECGWQPVSLTDLITSVAVKKVYRKATLNLHPDKLHRATLQQKCIAEKIFDTLKEAYSKFNSEEL